MARIEQLADLCRKTLQRLENSSDIAGLLLQGDQVFMLHGCSAVNDLLGPLSLSDDQNLLRCVAATGDAGSAREIVSRRPANMVPPFHPSQQGASPPPGGSVKAQFYQKQNAPVADAGFDSSVRSRQLLKNLFDDVRHELETKYQDGDRTSQQKRFAAALDHSTAYHPFPDSLEEKARTDWFDNHPRHKTAASTLLPRYTEKFISAQKLNNWAAPFHVGEGLIEGDSVGQQGENAGTAVASAEGRPAGGGEPGQVNRAAVSQKVSNLQTGQPDGRTPDTLWERKSAVATFLQQDGPAGQLEQLLEKWKRQGNRETTQKKKEHLTEEQILEIAAGPYPQTPYLSEKRGDRYGFAGEDKSPMDNDHYFSETLERVLQREIRRHGMEEDP